ncbi:hypothetical protein KAFR_0A05270 [Kazachstania africana CBS 2517]|uniref:Ribosomal RNA-processing protein 9 n=1 Tax=Kazachstania africana (strain ATCC 22294 / BCRC 22015 / CBS 2517 / CECT 1963 / NBRC 1671 / NRRL Y-8276) TaxID=1071382 RepID=H2ANL2_KAZAF|nr:hypothetical protein KAFR_0A05270 [Kazachstania africana CBS 2517]CCF55962.1 hypothetical protein KAFR_0A05270 [Kazachstania africana CBS 2517]
MSQNIAPRGTKRGRKDNELPTNAVDEDITDISSSEENNVLSDVDNDIGSDEEFEGENPADKRRRLAKQYLENLKYEASAIRSEMMAGEEAENGLVTEVDDYNNFDAGDLDKDIIASRLKQDVAEQQGRVYRFIADKLLLSESKVSFTRIGEKNPTCISCFQSESNKFTVDGPNQLGSKSKGKIFAYTVSKDLQLTKYDVTDFTKRPKKLKYNKGGVKFVPEGKNEYENTTEGHYDEILAVATSPDGKYVVTGGRDKKLIVWSAESLSPIKVIPTKDRRGQVMSLTFRKNSDQLYVACADYKIRTYSINQFSQLETLYGHQDTVVDIASLAMERCVTVGSRDRTAMLWKIPDETRLTFRGGEDPEKLLKKWMRENATQNEEEELIYPDESLAPTFYTEGSIDVVTMVDDSHFITGSDNGNISLWSLSKKKPIYTVRTAHGVRPAPEADKISGEASENLRKQQLQNEKLTHPYWITAVHAIPYSNIFVSGSWDGSLRVWKIEENMRGFKLLGELQNCKGVVTKIQVVENGRHGKETFRILASVSKEHKLGKWIEKVPGARNGIYSAVIEQIRL